MACKRLGWREVPTIRLDHLTDVQKRAFVIADNRLAELAGWDSGLLRIAQLLSGSAAGKPRDLNPKPASRRNEPAYLPHIAATVAQARGETLESLAHSSSAAARALFALRLP